MLLSDQGWDPPSPEAQAELRAEGAAFQTDMASELVAPFDFQDVLVPHCRYGTAQSRAGQISLFYLPDP